MFCTNCGEKLPDKGKFCPFCGAQLHWKGDDKANTESVSTATAFEATGETTVHKKFETSENQNSTVSQPITASEEFFGFSDTSTVGKIITITCFAIRLFLLFFVLQVSTKLFFDEYIDVETAQTSFFLSGFFILGIAKLTKNVPAGNIDRIFLILPNVSLVVGILTIVLNFGAFCPDFIGFIYSSVCFFVLSGGTTYCNNVYLVRFQKEKLKKKIAQMSDEEIEELKEYTIDSSEIEDLKRNTHDGEKESGGK